MKPDWGAFNHCSLCGKHERMASAPERFVFGYVCDFCATHYSTLADHPQVIVMAHWKWQRQEADQMAREVWDLS